MTDERYEVVREEVPEQNRGGRPRDPWLERLQVPLHDPGHSYRVYCDEEHPRRAVAHAAALRDGHRAIPPGRWEFVAREGKVYATYLGPEEEQPTPRAVTPARPRKAKPSDNGATPHPGPALDLLTEAQVAADLGFHHADGTADVDALRRLPQKPESETYSGRVVYRRSEVERWKAAKRWGQGGPARVRR